MQIRTECSSSASAQRPAVSPIKTSLICSESCETDAFSLIPLDVKTLRYMQLSTIMLILNVCYFYSHSACQSWLQLQSSNITLSEHNRVCVWTEAHWLTLLSSFTWREGQPAAVVLDEPLRKISFISTSFSIPGTFHNCVILQKQSNWYEQCIRKLKDHFMLYFTVLQR